MAETGSVKLLCTLASALTGNSPQDAAPALHVPLQSLETKDAKDFEPAMIREHADAMTAHRATLMTKTPMPPIMTASGRRG
jgi:hypothetical protein